MKEKLKLLYGKDNTTTYRILLELEASAADSDELYSYFDELIEMLKHEKSSVRVRGFRLICSLAKWDKKNKTNENIDTILDELDDDISTSVRQCLNRLNILLMYKPELSENVEKKLKSLDVSKYKESMQSLINRDIEAILNSI